jgi:hypothetical protein
MGDNAAGMLSPTGRISDTGKPYGTPGSPACPVCGQYKLSRIRRRPIDHVMSIFGRLRRYRCYEFSCQWEGNLKGLKRG